MVLLLCLVHDSNPRGVDLGAVLSCNGQLMQGEMNHVELLVTMFSDVLPSKSCGRFEAEIESERLSIIFRSGV